MKKYLYGLAIFMILAQQEAGAASWYHVEQQLNALDSAYGLLTGIITMPGTSGDMKHWGHDRLTPDGRGARIGTIIGGRYGKTEGAIIGGLVYGAAYYIDAYWRECEQEDGICALYPSADTPQKNRPAKNRHAPIGSEIGELHRCLVREVLECGQIPSSMTREELYEYMCTADFATLNAHFTAQQIRIVRSGLMDYAEALAYQGNDIEAVLLSGCPEEVEIINHYVNAVARTAGPFERQRYTHDYMRLVDKACRANWISEESAILINGTISSLSKTCQD